jgi:hypothetical protein
MKVFIFAFLFMSFLVLPSFGQIKQTYPEFCGKADREVPLPSNVRASIDLSQGQGILYIQNGDATTKIELHGVVNAVNQVCPLSDSRWVVFANANPEVPVDLAEVYIVDSNKASLLETIWGFAPVLSPDQRWLVYRKFHPERAELSISEEYLLYDLAKSPAQNRQSGVPLDDYDSVGMALFPVTPNRHIFENIGVPEEQVHAPVSGFYWASDSRAVVFADRLQRKLSIVWVNLDNGNPTARVYPVTPSEVCSAQALNLEQVGIEHIEATAEQNGDRTIRVSFRLFSDTCVPKTLELHLADFQPVKTEGHTEPKRKLSVVDPA